MTTALFYHRNRNMNEGHKRKENRKYDAELNFLRRANMAQDGRKEQCRKIEKEKQNVVPLDQKKSWRRNKEPKNHAVRKQQAQTALSRKEVAEQQTRHVKQKASQLDARDDYEITDDRAKNIAQKVVRRYSWTEEQKYMQMDYNKKVRLETEVMKHPSGHVYHL